MVRDRGKSGSSSSKLFAKRCMSLKKKIYELTTLCDLDGCLIIKGPNGELETWPENRDEVETVIQRYKNMNEEDRSKNTSALSSFLIDKKKELEIQIHKIRNENDSKSKELYPTWNKRIDELSEDSLREMRYSLESKLENVKSRVKMKKQMIMMMNRGSDDHQKENTAAITTSCTINNPYFVKVDNFAAMGGGLNYDQDSHLLPVSISSLVPQTHEFFDFNSYHHRQQQQQNHNLLPIIGTMSSSMYDSGFGMMENHHHIHQYYTNLMSDDGNNYSTNSVSLPPLPPTMFFSHDQSQPLQACVSAAPSFQIEDHDYFLNSIYSHHQQQQQDFDSMPINGGDTY